jgi:Holliday junction DNA helicase RuvA
MISTVHGRIQSIGTDELVVDVGGVGLQIGVPLARLAEMPKVGHSIQLFTRLIVREDSLSLYGFDTDDTRELFDELIEVSGVGPRLALAILAHLSPDSLRHAIAGDQPEALTKVPGIGRKTAEKIVFHLKDRLTGADGMAAAISGLDTEVLSVLTSLGYSLVEAQAAIQSIPKDAPEDIEDRVRLALRYFAGA